MYLSSGKLDLGSDPRTAVAKMSNAVMLMKEAKSAPAREAKSIHEHKI